MRADLHVHSTYSDGLYSPDEVCKRAKAKGVQLLSITDHDTLEGLEVKMQAAKKYALAFVSGWEISAYEGMEKIHMLGYGCEKNEAYEKFLEARKAASMARALDSVQKLNKLGIPIRIEDIEAEHKDKNSPIHTMHVSRALAKYVGGDSRMAYDTYLNVGRPANSNIGRPSPREAIDCIHALGGVAVIAHPGRITLPAVEIFKLIKSLADYGMDGIEGYYTTHTDRETAAFCALAKELGLLITGGSDTHYEEETHTFGKPEFYVDEAFLQAVSIMK